jgi:hypothetical protein
MFRLHDITYLGVGSKMEFKEGSGSVDGHHSLDFRGECIPTQRPWRDTYQFSKVEWKVE